MIIENNGVETKDQNAPAGQVVEGQSATTDDGNQIDYKAELEKALEEKENYKTGMLNAKDKLKKYKKGEDDDDSDEDEDEDEKINEKVNRIVEERLEGLKKDVNSATVETILESISASEDEKNLIRFHYENSIRQSGMSANDIKKDLENAKLMANRNKLLSDNAALKDALLAKNSISSAGVGSSSVRTDIFTEVKLNSGETKLFERMNARRVSRGEKALTPKDFLEINN